LSYVAKRLGSWTGLVFAALTALLFATLYAVYLSRAGTWLADLPLVMAALPFTLVMRALNGGSYHLTGAMTGRVVIAAIFCSALAYAAGLFVETLIRALLRVARQR
jgi:hypothetical protein